MARQVKSVSAKEILEILKKTWLGTKDIQIIASVGLTKARNIKKEITDNLTKEKKYFLPPGLVPSEEVTKYLNLNIKYLKKLSEIERG